MTIDCLKSGKRILLMVHDSQPEVANYQFCLRDEDPANEFDSIAIENLTAQMLYDWMKKTFSTSDWEQSPRFSIRERRPDPNLFCKFF